MADKEVTKEQLESFHKMVEESWKKNPNSPLIEKGVSGTDSSFKTPVVSPKEYLELTKKLREQYGKKLRPWEREPSENPFKGPIKKLEKERRGKEWDMLLKDVDKNYSKDAKSIQEGDGMMKKWTDDYRWLDYLKKRGSKIRQI